MKKALLSALVLFAVSNAASAAVLLLPNGGFETDPNPSGGFTQTITNWQVGFVGAPAGTLPAIEQSGLFTSYGKFNTAPQGGQYAMITNLGGGVTTLTSGTGAGNNFFVADRMIGFRYAYITNDPAAAASHDLFKVHLDFFATASSVLVTGTRDFTIPTDATFNDTGAASPFAGSANNANTALNNAVGGTFNFIALDISPFFLQFARISFIIENGGPAGGTNGNGLGVSGVVLDNVFLTPEPSTIALFALGAAGLGGFAWRRRTAKKPVSA